MSATINRLGPRTPRQPDEATLSDTLFLADDAATTALGRRLAAALRAGDLVLLEGDLGAGKTALARAIIRALLKDEALEVPSPSFALVQPYEGDGIHIIHADLYRLHDEHEIDELGLFERSDAIVLAEWPERAPGLALEAGLIVRLAIPNSGEGRTAEVAFADRRAW